MVRQFHELSRAVLFGLQRPWDALCRPGGAWSSLVVLDTVPLITHVATTPANVSDGRLAEPIHQVLASKALLPAQHLVDTGYVDADLLLTSRSHHALDLMGPTRKDYKWQARAQAGFAASDFQIDWQRQVATCPVRKAKQV